jgi:iron complex transport system substrate-binding protein
MYPRIALETVLREDPDMILDMSRDMSGEQESEVQRKVAATQASAVWDQQTQLKAVRTGRIIVGTSDALLVPGPRAPEAARLLFDYMHSTTTKERSS